MLFEILLFAKYYTFYFQSKHELSTGLHHQILKKAQGRKFAICGSQGFYSSPDNGKFSVWNFLSQAGTGQNYVCLLGMWVEQQAVTLAFTLFASTTCFFCFCFFFKRGGENGEKRRDILCWLIPSSSKWTWKCSYRFQSLIEIRNLKFWLLCLKIWILSHMTDTMLFEIKKINALQTSFA